MNVLNFAIKILKTFPMFLTYDKKELIEYFSEYSSKNKIYNMQIYDGQLNVILSKCGNKEYYYSFHFYEKDENSNVVSYGKDLSHRMNFSFEDNTITIRVFPHHSEKDKKLDITFDIEELMNLPEEELILHIMSQDYNGFREIFDEFLEGLKC